MRAAQPLLGISLQGGDGHLTTQIDPVLALQPRRSASTCLCSSSNSLTR
jgi:hypothetical protein